MSATTSTQSRTALWRYNYKILMGTGYWILVLPIAASQVVTLWMMAMATAFDQTAATFIGELMTPIIGAFLVAHSLAPEYRSGTGTVLACKPVSLHRVVTIRVGLAMLLALALSWVTLMLCSVLLQRIDVTTPLLAALPSLFFLSLLALTFATLFRSALGGFGVAAVVWALDVKLGYGVQPFLSLQGLSGYLTSDPMRGLWQIGKGTLMAGGLLLLLVHGRLLPRICRPAGRTDVLRVAAWVAGVVILYCGSGAAATIGYAHRNRGNLPVADVDWLRRQLGAYAPVPVASFFGPAFAAYLSQPPAQEGGSRAEPRLAQLERAAARWPSSMWADSIAWALARQQETMDPSRSVAAYHDLADEFSNSPFAPKALVAVLRIEGADEAARQKAIDRLLAEYPNAPEAERAADQVLEKYPAAVTHEEMERAALIASKVAPRQRRPGWWMVAAHVRLSMGNTDGAREAARQARDLGKALRTEEETNHYSELGPFRVEIIRAHDAAEALLRELGGP
jgi:hypothetical protein